LLLIFYNSLKKSISKRKKSNFIRFFICNSVDLCKTSNLQTPQNNTITNQQSVEIMKKQILSLALIAVLGLSVQSCNKKEATTDPKEDLTIGNKVDSLANKLEKATDSAATKMEKAADSLKADAEKGAKKIEEAAKKVKEGAKKTADDVKETLKK
jgi:uncharacterized protein YbjQ (UPF0145 family)